MSTDPIIKVGRSGQAVYRLLTNIREVSKTNPEVASKIADLLESDLKCYALGAATPLVKLHIKVLRYVPPVEPPSVPPARVVTPIPTNDPVFPSLVRLSPEEQLREVVLNRKTISEIEELQRNFWMTPSFDQLSLPAPPRLINVGKLGVLSVFSLSNETRDININLQVEETALGPESEYVLRFGNVIRSFEQFGRTHYELFEPGEKRWVWYLAAFEGMHFRYFASRVGDRDHSLSQFDAFYRIKNGQIHRLSVDDYIFSAMSAGLNVSAKLLKS